MLQLELNENSVWSNSWLRPGWDVLVLAQREHSPGSQQQLGGLCPSTQRVQTGIFRLDRDVLKIMNYVLILENQEISHKDLEFWLPWKT